MGRLILSAKNVVTTAVLEVSNFVSERVSFKNPLSILPALNKLVFSLQKIQSHTNF
jgi:hypothetical protein